MTCKKAVMEKRYDVIYDARAAAKRADALLFYVFL
jgi:hypothetical protein